MKKHVDSVLKLEMVREVSGKIWKINIIRNEDILKNLGTRLLKDKIRK